MLRTNKLKLVKECNNMWSGVVFRKLEGSLEQEKASLFALVTQSMKLFFTKLP